MCIHCTNPCDTAQETEDKQRLVYSQNFYYKNSAHHENFNPGEF